MDAPHDVRLPEGLSARTLTVDDVDDVVAMVNVCELHDTGELMWERADVLADASTQGFDRDGDWVAVFDAGEVVGWAMVVHVRSAWADVRPSHRGRGVGTWLRRWTETRAATIGSPRIGQTLDDALEGPQRLLRDAGYTPRHTSWVLQMDHPERPAEPAPPAGVTLRPWRPEDTGGAMAMFERAFAEWPDRLPSTPVTWRAMTIGREGFVPEDLVLAVEDGEIVGGAFILDADEILDRQAGGGARGAASRRRPGAAHHGLPAVVRPGVPADAAQHGLEDGRADPVRARRDARDPLVHAPRHRPAVSLPTLPPGFTARRLTFEDADVVADLVGDCEAFEDGEREIDAADLRAFWSIPGTDLSRHSIAVWRGDRLAAAGDVRETYSEIDVHPDFRGRGLGSAIVPWTWEQARAQGADHVSQTFTDARTDGAALFRAHGYAPGWTSWMLRIALEGVVERPLPPGYTMRDLDYEPDARAVFDA